MARAARCVCASGWFYVSGIRRVYCVCIDNGALEAFLDRSAGTTGTGGAGIASQGGAPC